ncbi:hypothetical protein [Aurantimonas sp. HBX-1]|uniref:hypothetical protein n=1 Tax=Aurantimonas sp. HBX-1 TaxID=2906072 RepID=UPI001F20ED6D|nr:hypothetical protein [Aurantimonas sp. HBX-1]UIJ73395.1 hypothetical protein LXB15_07100 [Aurantimonas sp. HBX-1]
MGQKKAPRAVRMVAGALAFMAFAVFILAAMGAYLVFGPQPDTSLSPGSDSGGQEASSLRL